MSKLTQLLKGRCPRCGEGRIFESPNPYKLRQMLQVRKRCSHCDLDFSPEPGFYWGATYVDYALTVAFSAFTFLMSTLIFGFMNSLSWQYVAGNALLLLIFCPIFFRFGRVLWLWMAYERD
jgi:uncharacterized protein (DUF983 family)